MGTKGEKQSQKGVLGDSGPKSVEEAGRRVGITLVDHGFALQVAGRAPFSTPPTGEKPVCTDCKAKNTKIRALERENERLTRENERLLAAIHRESHHIDKRAGHSGFETVILKKD